MLSVSQFDPELTWAGPTSVWRIRSRVVGHVEDSDCGKVAGHDGEEGASRKIDLSAVPR